MQEELPADSSRTLSRLYMDLKQAQDKMGIDIDYIKKDVTEIKDSVKDFHTLFGEFKRELKEDNDKFFLGVDKALAEKANLWVEWFCKISIGLLGTGGVGLVIFILEEFIRSK
jgi:uncharacterized OsmC-like protein